MHRENDFSNPNEIETLEKLHVVAFAALAGQILRVLFGPEAGRLAPVNGRQ